MAFLLRKFLILSMLGMILASPIISQPKDQQNLEIASESGKTLEILALNNEFPNANSVASYGAPNGAQAKCYDNRLANIMTTAIQNYLHDMDQLSKYVMDQIKRYGYTGYWFVHAAQIGQQKQGVDWQSRTNGDLFGSSGSKYGCYYHDQQTFIVVLRYGS